LRFWQRDFEGFFHTFTGVGILALRGVRDTSKAKFSGRESPTRASYSYRLSLQQIVAVGNQFEDHLLEMI
jgi:hypothetical protein